MYIKLFKKNVKTKILMTNFQSLTQKVCQIVVLYEQEMFFSVLFYDQHL